MKINKFYGWMAAAALVFTAASCQNNDDVNVPGDVIDYSQVYGNGSKLVTLSVAAPDQVMGTRADGLHISDGKKADTFMFSVYVSDKENGDFEMAPEFIKGEGKYNTISDVTFPLTFQLATDPAKYYKIVSWAQESTTEAFDLTSFPTVKVKYGQAKNNDELRDAFCVTSQAISGNTKDAHIVLRRPFAQINVGTTGADYKNLLQGEKVYPNRALKYSKVVINGAYDQINIFTDEITSSANKGLEVTFAYAALPAYYTLNNVIPEGKDKLLLTDGEEFLKVKLNPGIDDKYSGEILPYKTSYPTYNENAEDGNKYLTETFKYLSMCYVLVPSPDKNNPEPVNPFDPYHSTTLNKVSVYFAENSDYSDGYAYINLDNVPVHRNWRTNILGGLSNTDDGEPDDPSSLFNFTKVCVHLDPIFFGEWNNVNGSNSWFDNQFPGDLNDNLGDGSSNPDHSNK